MTGRHLSPETLGREVLGPIVGEFCLRLWSVGGLLRAPDAAMLLFCARGGLRMQLAYETFLRASGLPSVVPTAPLMVSRLVAVRSALLRTVTGRLDTLVPAAAATLAYELPDHSLAAVAQVATGVSPDPGSRWEASFTAAGFAALLHHRDGRPVVNALMEQGDLFARHLTATLAGRPRAVLVDTGLFGTTAQLLGDGFPALDVSTVLIARSNYRREQTPSHTRVFGLSVQADGYSPILRRTAVLRYWQFMESLFEPELESVRHFSADGGRLRSNLEVPGWQDRVPPAPGSAFSGVLQYLRSLEAGSAQRILSDVGPAWDRLRRSIVWPTAIHGEALRAGRRSYDFGSDETFTDVTRPSALATLRGTSMWREGEVARSGSVLRLPLLAGLETAHTVRRIYRAVGARRALSRRPAV